MEEHSYPALPPSQTLLQPSPSLQLTPDHYGSGDKMFGRPILIFQHRIPTTPPRQHLLPPTVVAPQLPNAPAPSK
jgi:hypothetical protein